VVHDEAVLTTDLTNHTNE